MCIGRKTCGYEREMNTYGEDEPVTQATLCNMYKSVTIQKTADTCIDKERVVHALKGRQMYIHGEDGLEMLATLSNLSL